MKSRIDIDIFDQQSVRDAAKLMLEFQNNFMPKLLAMLTELAENGVQIVDSTKSGILIDGHPADGTCRFEIKQLSNVSAMAKIIFEGTEVLFVEFGTGIRFSNPQNPKAGEMGMGVGTYPGQTHAFDPKGWWIPKEHGGGHSYGNPAVMPMYKADEDLKNFQKVARIFDKYFG